jgi:hypothetical protein
LSSSPVQSTTPKHQYFQPHHSRIVEQASTKKHQNNGPLPPRSHGPQPHGPRRHGRRPRHAHVLDERKATTRPESTRTSPADSDLVPLNQMLFTWDTTNLCIVFPSWRVTGTLSLIVSLLAVVALTAGYEAIREVSRRYEERLEQNVREAPRKLLPSAMFLCVFCRQGLVVWVTSKPRLRIPFYANAKTTSNEAHSLLLWQAMPSRRKRRRARRSRLRCMACRCFTRFSSCESTNPRVHDEAS